MIATIEDTLRIQSEGRQKRQAAEQELLQIEDRLKDALLKGPAGTIPYNQPNFLQAFKMPPLS